MSDMSDDATKISIFLNGNKVTVQKDLTILEASSKNMVDIPTICWSEHLEPANADSVSSRWKGQKRSSHPVLVESRVA